ncbi:hypothetical protein ACT7T5_001727, partial [Vibrio cholerae]
AIPPIHALSFVLSVTANLRLTRTITPQLFKFLEYEAQLPLLLIHLWLIYNFPHHRSVCNGEVL